MKKPLAEIIPAIARAIHILAFGSVASALPCVEAPAQQDSPMQPSDCLSQLDEYVERLGLTPEQLVLKAARARCLHGDTASAFEIIDFDAKHQDCTIDVNNFIISRPELENITRETQDAAMADCMRGGMPAAQEGLLGATNPRIDVLKVSTGRIAAGGSASVTWSVVNADTVLFGEPDPADERSLLRAQTVKSNGTLVLSPTSTTTYVLQAENRAQDTARQQFTVEVLQPIVLNFDVQPTQVCPERRDRVTLQWKTQHADEVTLNDHAAQSSGQKTEQPRGSTNSTMTYQIVAKNTFESVEAKRQVRIIACAVEGRDHRTPAPQVRDHRTIRYSDDDRD
jgi:hypothetical protein